MSDYQCPECGAERIRNFVFDHNRTTCQLGKNEDATKMADFERLANRWQITRSATDTEIILAEHIAGHELIPEAEFRHPYAPPELARLKTIVTKRVKGIHHRVIGGIDPDDPETIPTEEEN